MFSSVLFSVNAFSQNTKFEIVFGAAQYEYPRSVIQTWDKGFLVTGSTSSFGFGNSDIHVLKVDSAGNWKWETTFGGSNIEWGYDVVETPDSGYAVAGYTNSFGAGGYDMYVVRVDKSGSVLWSKTYGGSDWDFAYSIKNTNDGGFIIAGSTYSSGAGDEDMYLVKTDGNGTVQWAKTYGGVNEDRANAVLQASDGAYVMTGYTNSYGAGDYDMYTIKTNSAGDTLWTRTAGGMSDDEGTCNLQSQDSNFVSAGYSKSSGLSGSYDYYLIKYDTSGAVTWIIDSLGAGADDKAYSITLMKNGSLGIVGSTRSFGAGLNDYLLFILNAGGYYTGGGNYGGANEDVAYSVKSTADNGFIIAGETQSYGKGLTDIYLLKTDSLGKSSGVVIVGVGEKDKINTAFSSRVFPNPANEYFYFSLDKDNVSAQHNLSVSLSDISGRLVHTKKNISAGMNGFFKLDIENFIPGLYIFSVYSGNEKIITEKIVIQH